MSQTAGEGGVIADLPALYEDRGNRPPLPEHCELILIGVTT